MSLKKARSFEKGLSWSMFFVTCLVIGLILGGQSLIHYLNAGAEDLSPWYLVESAAYLAIVALAFCLVTKRQMYLAYDGPMHILSEAAKQVAGGDFSVWLAPVHVAEKKDYMDLMFEDFNKMVEELGSIETLKDDFIANVSHEIKTPLSVIQSYAMALQREDLSPESRDEYASTIAAATKKLTTLVTNILKLNKLEHQRIAPAAEPYDLCRQLCDCAIAFESLWEEKGISFEASIEDRAVINKDEGMMEIVWQNLLSNALKFTERGGKVTLTQTSQEDSVTVSVSDSGCGMDEGTILHVFDKFYQGDSSRSQDGNGLGLALALRVIELAKGRIAVQSAPGKGSTFTVTLGVE